MVRAPSHAQAIAARKKFLADRTTEGQRIDAEFAAAEAEYKAWLTPKARFEAAKNERHAFQRNSQALAAELDANVIAAADPRIHAAIRSLEHDREQTAVHISVEGARLRGGTACKPGDVDARLRAIAVAIDQLKALIYVECSDVPGTIRKIMSMIPQVDWS